jgi:hypothetical protein
MTDPFTPYLAAAADAKLEDCRDFSGQGGGRWWSRIVWVSGHSC